MRGVCSLIWLALVGLFHSRVSLEAEILALRHQLNVLRRISPKKPTFTIIDRLVFAGLYRLAPGILDALVIVTPAEIFADGSSASVTMSIGIASSADQTDLPTIMRAADQALYLAKHAGRDRVVQAALCQAG
jgi:GGDEF domain-containing protein